MNRFSHEMRAARRLSHERIDPAQVKIYKLSADRAQRVIVPLSLTIVAARCITEGDLAYEASLSQEAQRIVNRCVADPRQKSPRRLEDICRRRVILAFTNNAKNDGTLAGQRGSAILCRLSCFSHSSIQN